MRTLRARPIRLAWAALGLLMGCGSVGPAFDLLPGAETDASIPDVTSGGADAASPADVMVGAARDSASAAADVAAAEESADVAMDTPGEGPSDVSSADTANDTTDSAPDASEGAVADSTADAVDAPVVVSSFGVAGTVTGLASGAQLVLANNGDLLTVSANGFFNFGTAVPSGQPYDVTVVGQPMQPSQTCTVTSGMGTVGTANVTSVAVVCATNTFDVGGTLTGLPAGDTVVLADDGGDDLMLDADGAFTFATEVASGSNYAVTVLVQAADGAVPCVVSAGTGIVGGGAVTSVAVNCTAGSYTIGGTLAGLAPGDAVALEDSAGDTAFLTNNGPFAFPTPVISGGTYAVTLLGNPMAPVAQSCVIAMGSGSVGDLNVSSVDVTCTTQVFMLGGTLSGLDPTEAVVLENNGGNDLTLTANGAFAFPVPFPSGEGYSVTVVTNPASPNQQICSVTGGSGTVSSANVTGVQVTCVDSDCATACTGGGTCVGAVCTFDCESGGCNSVSCPSGVPCNIVCNGGCDGFLTCPSNAACEIDCAAGGCDGIIQCSGPSCTMTCNGGCDGIITLDGTTNDMTCSGGCDGPISCGGTTCTIMGAGPDVTCTAATCNVD